MLFDFTLSIEILLFTNSNSIIIIIDCINFYIFGFTKQSLLSTQSRNRFLYRTHQVQRLKLTTVRLEKFTVELHPLQTKSMQETLHRVHTHNHTHSNREKEILADDNYDSISPNNTSSNRLFKEHSGKLSMSK